MQMKKVVTYYDSLKVARNSPSEVIRAAYRALCQKYHPDKYPDRERAERIMKILNKANEVLSDPAKRQAHDAWIVEQEAAQATADRERTSSDERQPRVPRGSAGTSGSMGPGFDDAARFRHEKNGATGSMSIGWTAGREGRRKLGYFRRIWLTFLLIVAAVMLLVVFPYQLFFGRFEWIHLVVAMVWFSAGRYSYIQLLGTSQN